MTIPDFQTLMLPVLQLARLGEIRISDAVEQLAAKYELSDEERAHLLPSGRQTTFANRVHWAKSYLGKAGLIALTRRGYFQITSAGESVLASPPQRIDIRFLRQFPEFQTFRESADAEDGDGSSTGPGEMSALTPDEAMRNAHMRLEVDLADELIRKVRAGSPAFFERLVVRLLIAMGYGGSVNDLDRALVGGTGDDGIDGIIDQDFLGLDRIYVQVKKYKEGNTVGAGEIRDFYGALDMKKASKGIFVTASTFSPSAAQTANMLGKRIVLIDGVLLAKLMIRHGVGCRDEETYVIKKIDEDFFDA